MGVLVLSFHLRCKITRYCTGADPTQQVRELFTTIYTLYPNLVDIGIRTGKKKKKEPEMIL